MDNKLAEVDPDVVKNACNQVESLLNADIPLLIRIKFPLVWERLPNGIRIQDLHEDRFTETLEFIKSSYMTSEPICKSLQITDDEESVKHYCELILSRMQDTQSIIALKEDENRVIGCLIERVVNCINMKTVSRMSIYEGARLCKIQRLRKHILKQINLKELYGTDRYNDVYIWSVEEQHRSQGIGKALMKAAIRQTRLFNIKMLGGVFTSDLAQMTTKNMGFESIYELLYSSWVEGQEVVIENPGAKNYSANFMLLVFNDIEVEKSEEKVSLRSSTSSKRHHSQKIDTTSEAQSTRQGAASDKLITTSTKKKHKSNTSSNK